MKTLNKLRTLSLLSGCLVLLGLFGCGDSKKENDKEPNVKNFTKALQVALDEDRDNSDICIRPSIQSPPYEINSDDHSRDNKASQNLYEILVDAGLLTRHEALVKSGKPGFKYDLTEEGKKYYRTIVGSSYFCFGHRKVKAIESTSPSGYTAHYFTYTYSIEDVPNWAKIPDIKEKFLGIAGKIDGSPRSEVRGEWNEGHWRIEIACYGDSRVCKGKPR